VYNELIAENLENVGAYHEWSMSGLACLACTTTMQGPSWASQPKSQCAMALYTHTGFESALLPGHDHLGDFVEEFLGRVLGMQAFFVSSR
jgi:hypothetical protein